MQLQLAKSQWHVFEAQRPPRVCAHASSSLTASSSSRSVARSAMGGGQRPHAPKCWNSSSSCCGPSCGASSPSSAHTLTCTASCVSACARARASAAACAPAPGRLVGCHAAAPHFGSGPPCGRTAQQPADRAPLRCRALTRAGFAERGRPLAGLAAAAAGRRTRRRATLVYARIASCHDPGQDALSAPAAVLRSGTRARRRAPSRPAPSAGPRARRPCQAARLAARRARSGGAGPRGGRSAGPRAFSISAQSRRRCASARPRAPLRPARMPARADRAPRGAARRRAARLLDQRPE